MKASDVIKICDFITYKELKEMWMKIYDEKMPKNKSKNEGINELTLAVGRKRMAHHLLDIRRKEADDLEIDLEKSVYDPSPVVVENELSEEELEQMLADEDDY